MSRIVSESKFREVFFPKLDRFKGIIKSVAGPGRSGAVASVYASHYLRVPWLPMSVLVPEVLQPCLIVDTARKTGATLRRAARRATTDLVCYAFDEPPRLFFWYEPEAIGNGSVVREANHPQEGEEK